MTHAEIRALLARCDPRELRLEAGISSFTVQRALGLSAQQLSRLERKLALPTAEASLRWADFVAGLYRHALVTAELAAAERLAA